MNNPLSEVLDAPCKCCGTKALTAEKRGTVRVFMCALCGDSWMANMTDDMGQKRAEWVHHPNTHPSLSRSITMEDNPNNVPADYDDEEFTYYVEDRQVGSERWHSLLEERRNKLKARVAN